MAGDLGQGMNKLDVGLALKTACGSIWLQRRPLAALSVVPVLLVAVIDLLARPYVAGLEQILAIAPDAEWQTGIVVAGQIRDVLHMAVWTVLELACYRLFLLGPGSDLPGSKMWAIYVSLLAFNIALMMLMNVPSLVVNYAEITGRSPTWQAVRLVIFAAYMFVSIRLVFVFPAISLGNPWDLPQRWTETEGNFWRLLLLFIPAYLLVILLTSLFSGLGIQVNGSLAASGGLSVFGALADSVTSWVFLLFATAATAAAVTQLTDIRAAGMTGQGPGPTEIASRFD